MTSHWHRGQAHYRCVFPTAYALPPGSDHPKTVYIRESSFLPQLTDWLVDLFTGDQLDETCRLLVQAQRLAPDEATEARNSARSDLFAAEQKIARCEQLLEAGSDPATVTSWLNAAVEKRDRAKRILSASGPSATVRCAEDFRRQISELPDLAEVFAEGDVNAI